MRGRFSVNCFSTGAWVAVCGAAALLGACLRADPDRVAPAAPAPPLPAPPLPAPPLPVVQVVPAPAEVRIRACDEGGRALPISRAEILARAWSEVEVFPLPVAGREVVLTLDRVTALLDRRFVQPNRVTAFLYIESPGRAPMRSRAFEWDGATAYRGAASRLHARRAGVGCGIAHGRIAVTGADGVARLERFCPEAYESVWVEDAEGATIWRSDPRGWTPGARLRVELDA